MCDHGSLPAPVATLLSIQNGFVSGQWDLLLLPIDKLPTDHLPLYNKVLITVRLTDHTHACRNGIGSGPGKTLREV